MNGILFDIWDNRQINVFKNYIQQLDKSLDRLSADDAQRTRAHNLISTIREINDYQDLYNLLGFKYIVDPRGSLQALEKESFDFAVSAGVMEHIYAKDAPASWMAFQLC